MVGLRKGWSLGLVIRAVLMVEGKLDFARFIEVVDMLEEEGIGFGFVRSG